MPLKKRNKLRSQIIFWTTAAAIAALMVYVPKKPVAKDGGGFIRYELY